MKRLALTILAAATLVLTPILPAAAAAPAPIRVTYQVDLSDTVDFCGFPVQVDITGRLAVILFLDESCYLTRTIEPSAGPVSATLTNLATGHTVTVKPSGPGRSASLPDSYTYTTMGPWLSFLDPRTGDGGIYLLRGLQTKTFTATSFDWRFDGQVVDLCSALSP